MGSRKAAGRRLDGKSWARYKCSTVEHIGDHDDAGGRLMHAQEAGVRVADLVARRWGAEGEISELGSFEDRVFTIGSGADRLVLKLVNRERAAGFDFEHRAMRCLAARGFPYTVPRPVPATGEQPAELVEVDGAVARALTWVPGRPLSMVPHLDRDSLTELGRLAARSVEGLAHLGVPSPRVDSRWDPRRAPSVVGGLLPGMSRTEQKVLGQALEPLIGLPDSLAAALPVQAIHGDITDFNVICEVSADTKVRLTGLIDFGDATWTWRICELAVTCEAAAARQPSSPLPAMLEVIAGYREVQDLGETEVDALWPLVLARAGACAALSLEHVRSVPSPYLETMRSLDWAALRALLALPDGLAPAAFRSAFGLAPRPAARGLIDRLRRAQPAAVVDGVSRERMVTVDLGITSEGIADARHECVRAITDAVAASDRTPVGRWGEIRFTHSGAPAPDPPETLHLGADIFTPAGTTVRAPLPAVVEARREREIVVALQLEGESAYLRLAGIRPLAVMGQALAAGEAVGTVDTSVDGMPAHVHVQLCTSPEHPGVAVPREHELRAWLALCPDPSPLLGIDAAAPVPADPSGERQQRKRVLAGAQKLYYDHAMPIVRGWRQYLYDAYGRPYLDVINNVAGVGHSHPHIAAAAQRQLRLLNTNSRFLYASMTAYAERVAALLPPELDNVFLVNSGSEACDLALQLARVYTARRDIVALAGAYHGWTTAVYELCSSPADNPSWRASVPSFVHIAQQPDPYRGVFGADASRYVRSVTEACQGAEGQGGVAAFISEPLLGNQGAVVPPAGYLQGVYATVREHGGLCIADEIQVGYGRTGVFWAFERDGVIPDIVIAAKAAGNGHPIGIVACRQEIAEAFGRRASFFSSTGGGPVSCEIGLAVLDVMRDERLQENAAAVGASLKEELERLAARRLPVGAVHGRGLYLGVDLVRDPVTKEPWFGGAHRICERLRDLGVIVQPTGDAGNVLKVKPPLCISAEDAAYFTARLDEALGELEAALQ